MWGWKSAENYFFAAKESCVSDADKETRSRELTGESSAV